MSTSSPTPPTPSAPPTPQPPTPSAFEEWWVDYLENNLGALGDEQQIRESMDNPANQFMWALVKEMARAAWNAAVFEATLAVTMSIQEAVAEHRARAKAASITKPPTIIT